MLYLWSCNQSVAWKCRHWNMLRPKKSQRNLANSRILRNLILYICTNVTVLLHSIWKLLSNTLFAFTFDYMYFFQFLPLSSSFFWKKHLFSSFFHSSGKKPISSGSFRTLDESEQKWVEEQNILTEEKLKQNAAHAQKAHEYVHTLLQKCKTWGVPSHVSMSLKHAYQQKVHRS